MKKEIKAEIYSVGSSSVVGSNKEKEYIVVRIKEMDEEVRLPITRSMSRMIAGNSKAKITIEII